MDAPDQRDGEALFSVSFVDAQTGWAVGDDGTILATANGGATWTPQTSGTEAALLSVSFVDAQTGWAVGFDGTILATANGGATWTPQTSGTEADLLSVSFVDAQTGWAVGADGTILATANGGATWEQQRAQPWASAHGSSNWFGADLQRADTAPDLQRALDAVLIKRLSIQDLDRLSTLIVSQAEVAQRRADLPSTTLSFEDQTLEAARAAVETATDDTRADAA